MLFRSVDKTASIGAPASANTPASSLVPPDRAGISGVAAVRASLPFVLSAPGSLSGMALGDVRQVDLNGKPAALLRYGDGLAGVVVLEAQVQKSAQPLPAGLPKVSVGGSSATELPTALGTLLNFQRAGLSYTVAGFVSASTVEAAARGL